MNVIRYSDSGWVDKSMSFDDACDLVERAGYDSPRELGYSHNEVTWLSPEYARSTQDPTWPENVPYWYTKG